MTFDKIKIFQQIFSDLSKYNTEEKSANGADLKTTTKNSRKLEVGLQMMIQIICRGI